jgi:hypothetical protein
MPGTPYNAAGCERMITNQEVRRVLAAAGWMEQRIVTSEMEETARESFDLNPLFAIGAEERFSEHALRLGKALYPLGEAGNGHVFLAIAADGCVFALMDDLWLLGESMEAAMETLILGRIPKLVFSG